MKRLIQPQLSEGFNSHHRDLKYKKSFSDDEDSERNTEFLVSSLKLSVLNQDGAASLLAAAVWLAVRRPRSSKRTIVKNIPAGTQFIDLTQPNNYILRLRPAGAPDKELSSPTTSNRSIQLNHLLYSLAKKFLDDSPSPVQSKRALTRGSPQPHSYHSGKESTSKDDQKRDNCAVCEESYQISQLFSISKCSHNFCKECLIGYIKTMVDTNKTLNIGCLDSSCDSSGLPEKISEFLMKQKEYMLDVRYKRIRSAGLALKFNKKVCPNETCYSILQDVNEEYRSCNTCKINLCWKCNNLYHDDSPCVATEPVDFLHCMDKNNIIKCPRCAVNITKAEGCNHMKCAACANEFCWICRKNYTPDHYSKFNPFGCPGLQFDETGQQTSTRWCLKARAYLFWVFIVLFFPVVYVVFLLGVPTFYYLKRQRNIVKENIKKKANLHKFKEDRGYSQEERVVVEEYKLRKEHSPTMKCMMCVFWGFVGIPFMALGLLISGLALPILPCYLVYKCTKKK